MPDFSVLIATRNRAESLRETLRLLAKQEAAGQFTYEVLVIDNASTDHTRQLVTALQPTFPILLRYLYEGRIGKSWALNRGLEQAQGRFLAFTDDDILLPPTWLWALWRCFQETAADGIAGRILPHWLVPRPAWLTDAVMKQIGSLGCLDHGPMRLSSREGHTCRWVGGNMAIRREATEQVGGFDPKMVRINDAEYYRRCVKRGLNVIYEPAALVHHKLGAERVTPTYFRQRYQTSGYYRAYLIPWRPAHLLTLLPLWWYRTTLRLAGRWTRHVVTRAPWVVWFADELRLRESLSLWFHRLQLWPWWCSQALTERLSSPRRL